MKKLKRFLAVFVFSFAVISCSNDDNDLEICTAEAETGIVTQVSGDEAHVSTSIVIDATPNQVWFVLTDFESMPNWSSTFQGLEGDISDGGQINALFLAPDGSTIAFPHILSYQEGISYGWSDPILTLPGIVDNHFYSVEFCGNQTQFVQTDEFRGNNENVLAIVLANVVLTDYQTFNQELKTEVERRF